VSQKKNAKADPLAKFAEAQARQELRAKCLHPHLRFKSFGGILQCDDCSKRWISADDKTDTPDYMYCNPFLNESQTRNDPTAGPKRK
jgi:hypothetical protein